MVTVELINDYFVEIDSYNHTLKQRYIGEDKEGNKKQSERTIGHYKDIFGCLEALVRKIPLDENDGRVISLKEYAEAAERSFNRVKEIYLDDLK